MTQLINSTPYIGLSYRKGTKIKHIVHIKPGPLCEISSVAELTHKKHWACLVFSLTALYATK